MYSDTAEGWAGMFSSHTSLDKVTIGGMIKNDGTVQHGFKGDISHVIVTTETITDEEAIEISEEGHVRAEEPENSDQTVAVSGVSLNKTTTTLEEETTLTLTATVTPENATNKTITWSSSDVSIASVVDGVVTAKKAGTVTIKAISANGKEGICTITVTPNVAKQELEVARGELDTALTQTTDKKEADYPAESWQQYKQALDVATAVKNNPDATKAQIEKAMQDLQVALQQLDAAQKEIQEVKNDLQTALTQVADKKEAEYTAESWKAFKEALDTAASIKDNAQASKEQIANAMTALQQAAAKLVKAPVSGDSAVEVEAAKGELNKVIANAEQYKVADYTPEAWTIFQKEIIIIREILNNPNATKAEVEAANVRLEAAVQTLQKTPAQQKALAQGTTSETVKVGTTFTIGNYKYKVKNTTEVIFTGVVKANKKVTIASKVTYAGKSFKVTSIASKALKGDKTVTQVKIGSNVTSIGKSAFEGCIKLNKLTIGSKVTKIDAKAFKGCKVLKKVSIPAKVTTIIQNIRSF